MTEFNILLFAIVLLTLSVVGAMIGTKFMLDERINGLEGQLETYRQRDESQQKELNTLRAKISRVEQQMDSVEQFQGLAGMDHRWRQQHSKVWEVIGGRR